MVCPPHEPSVLIVLGPVDADVVAAVVIVLELVLVVDLAVVDGTPVKVPAAQVTMADPAERYQFDFGSERHSPTVTGAPKPVVFTDSRMNLVKL